MVRGVVVGKVAGGFEQAVGIRSRKEWFRHKVSRKQLKGQWRAMEQAAVRRGWIKDTERDKVYDRGRTRPVIWEKGSPGCSLLCLVTLYYPLLISFNKRDLLKTKHFSTELGRKGSSCNSLGFSLFHLLAGQLARS